MNAGINKYKYRATAGFSLVELMVGMTIGLITVLVVMQVMQVSEARRQASTSGSDALVNAALGLYTIERDAKNAGYGMTAMKSAVGCPIVAKHGSTDIELDLVPVKIVDGADGVPDTVQFLASTKNGLALPTKIAEAHPMTAANFKVESELGAESGDIYLAVPSVLSTASPPTTWCSIFVHHTGSGGAGAGAGASNQILHPPGQSPLNHSGGGAIWPSAGYAIGDSLVNLGTLSNRLYSITPDTNFLRLTEFSLLTNTYPTVDVYPNIVQLQAVYGKDTSSPADGIVDSWNATAPTNATGWQQIIAVRIALVARGQMPESGVVTLDGAAAASTCDSTTPHPAALCWRPNPTGNGVKINVDHVPNWQRYRYRVLETTVPLRNIMWQQ